MSTPWWGGKALASFRKVFDDLKKEFANEMAEAKTEFRNRTAEARQELSGARRELATAGRELADVRRAVFRIGLSLSNFLYQTARDILLDILSPRVRQANHDWDTALEKAKIGELEEAIDLLTRASDTFRQVGSVENTVECSDDLFSLLVEVGQETEALIVCESLIEFLNGRIFDRYLANGYKTIGEMFRSLGSWTRGTEYHYLAKRMLEEDGHKNYALVLDFHIAKELRRREQHTEAIALLTSAIDSMKQEKTNQKYLGVFYSLLTRIYCDISEFNKAAEIHELARAWFSERGYDDIIALESAYLYESNGDADKAMASLHEYIQLTRGDWRKQQSAFSQLANIFLSKGIDEEAKKYFGLSINTLEDVRRNLLKTELRSSFLETAYHDYQQMIVSSVLLDDHWDALNHLELLKSRVLTEMISGRTGSPRMEHSLTAAEGNPIVSSAEKCIKEITHDGGPKNVLVFLFPFGAMTLIFLVRQVGTKAIVSHVSSDYSFEELMSDVQELGRLARGNESEARDQFLDTLLKKLYSQLFAPMEPYLSEQTEQITFIPYSGFHLLPLHAMFTEHNERREYLVDHYIVTYAPSAKILRHCMLMERASDGKAFVASANPRKDLWYSPQEARTIAALLKAEVNQESCRHHIVSGARDAYILHYTGHANGKALILHREGDSQAEDLYEAQDVFATLDLPQAWLVTLSACETGKVKLGKTDEYIGLPSAFIHAGAATVISSLWCVSDRSTTLLMRKMYELIRCGGGKAESLREAQLWLRNLTRSDEHMQELMGLVPGIGESPKDVSRFSHTRTSAATLSVEDLHKPYYWAGFICTGAP